VRRVPLATDEAVRLAAEAASAVKPDSLVILDLRGLCGFTDYFVIASAGTTRQARALADRVCERMAAAAVRLLHREGGAEGPWILLDYADFVIHIFDAETRRYYDLERLWGDAPRTVWIQAGVPVTAAVGRDASGP
jgi:ribosome-associated protein